MGTELLAAENDPLRVRFLDAGMRVLAREGYGGFKQSSVCAETGLTTGAFYHSFKSWRDFETSLIAYWRSQTTAKTSDWIRSLPEPGPRITAMISSALDLPHRTEAAIRVWATHDPAIRAAQREIDEQRTDSIASTLAALGVDEDRARRLAKTASLLITGHQCSRSSVDDLEWSLQNLVQTDPKLSGMLTPQ